MKVEITQQNAFDFLAATQKGGMKYNFVRVGSPETELVLHQKFEAGNMPRLEFTLWANGSWSASLNGIKTSEGAEK